jgi:Mrp family chromosome partitioning ATPase
VDKLKQIITEKRVTTRSTPAEHNPTSHDLVNRFIAGDMVLTKEERKRLWKPDTMAAKRVIYQGMENLEVLNAYRELRTKLLRKSNGSSSITLVTSAGGKSSHNSEVAFNLATAFAMDTSKSSIYVDCDPYVEDRQDLAIREFNFGLTDHLRDSNISLADATYPSGVEHLKLRAASDFLFFGVEKGVVFQLDRYIGKAVAAIDLPILGFDLKAALEPGAMLGFVGGVLFR